MAFEELNLDRVITKRLHKAGYHEPTPIQAQAVPTLLEGRDVIGLAPTGTGKTAAFIAPIAQRLLERASGRKTEPTLRALVIEPTRELAEQVANEAIRIIGGSGLRIACAFGGVGMMPQAEAIHQGAHILIATPGRIRDLLEAGHLTLGFIEHLVLDEADRMMDMGFLPQVDQIIRHLPEARQTALFTATMPQPVEELARQFLNNPVRIEIGEHTRTVGHIEQRLFPVADHLKIKLVLRLLEVDRRGGVLIFARTRRRVGWVAAALERNGIRTGAIHGDRTQAQRRRALEKFRRGELRAIVATDVAARGLHIEAVRTVINYDLPVQPEEYVHRVGRAGHGGAIESIEAPGEAITLLDPRDEAPWERICTVCDVMIPAEFIDDFDYQEPKAGREGSRRSKAAVHGDAAARRGSEKRPRRGRGGRQGDRQHKPPKIGGKPKRRHGPGRPIRGDEKPGGGVQH